MRVVVQRVTEADVTVDGTVVGAIGRGLVVLAGLAEGDDDAAITWMAQKLAGLRIFADAAGLMNASLADVGGQVLAISQFTLLGDASRGRRPSFSGALGAERAAPLFDRFIAALAGLVGSVATGRFGADMQVRLVNDGPVTLVIDR